MAGQKQPTQCDTTFANYTHNSGSYQKYVSDSNNAIVKKTLKNSDLNMSNITK
jgi:hypothetical protein